MTHVGDRLVGRRIAQARKSVLLLGPRQVGKSTLCRTLGADLHIDLADQAEFLAFSYRSEAGAEVDLVVDRGTDVLAIEIKASRNVSPTDTRGLQSLEAVAKKQPPLRKWIIYRGERRQKFDNGVEVWPVPEALAALE